MISVIITHRNDWHRLAQTVNSLLNTAAQGVPFEIIIVDDCSDWEMTNTELIPLMEAGISFLVNEEHLGVGASRNVGAAAAKGGVLLFTDAHMIYPVGWNLDAYNLAAFHRSVLFCSTYVSDVSFDSKWFTGSAIGGASLTHYQVKEDNAFTLSQLTPLPADEGKWFPYEVPAVIGACYFIHADYFRRLGGFTGLSGYGGDEQLLSWKVWLSGGRVLCTPTLKVVHLNSGPVVKHDYSKSLTNLAYVLRLVAGDDWYGSFVGHLPWWSLPFVYRAGNRSIPEFKREREPDWLSRRFKLQTLSEAFTLLLANNEKLKNKSTLYEASKKMDGRAV